MKNVKPKTEPTPAHQPEIENPVPKLQEISKQVSTMKDHITVNSISRDLLNPGQFKVLFQDPEPDSDLYQINYIDRTSSNRVPKYLDKVVSLSCNSVIVHKDLLGNSPYLYLTLDQFNSHFCTGIGDIFTRLTPKGSYGDHVELTSDEVRDLPGMELKQLEIGLLNHYGESLLRDDKQIVTGIGNQDGKVKITTDSELLPGDRVYLFSVYPHFLQDTVLFQPFVRITHLLKNDQMVELRPEQIFLRATDSRYSREIEYQELYRSGDFVVIRTDSGNVKLKVVESMQNGLLLHAPDFDVTQTIHQLGFAKIDPAGRQHHEGLCRRSGFVMSENGVIDYPSEDLPEGFEESYVSGHMFLVQEKKQVSLTFTVESVNWTTAM